MAVDARPKRDFICLNEACGKKFWWNASDDELDKKICLGCGNILHHIPSTESNDIGNPAYLKFNSLSSEGKHKILKERSHQHFNKEIKGRKDQMQKDMLKGMTGQ